MTSRICCGYITLFIMGLGTAICGLFSIIRMIASHYFTAIIHTPKECLPLWVYIGTCSLLCITISLIISLFITCKICCNIFGQDYNPSCNWRTALIILAFIVVNVWGFYLFFTSPEHCYDDIK